MKAVKPIIAFFALAMAVALSGCLGGGGGGEDEPKYEIFQGEATYVGAGDGLAQATTETITASQPVTLDNSMITEITFTIDVTDGDPDTNTDMVNEINILDSDGNSNILSGGATPYSQSTTITWDGVNPMNNTWTVDFSVVIEGGDDRWIGPIFWIGTPDNGFQYSVAVNYTFMVPLE
ncbi:MAG: hypothetical protein ACMUIG_02865 [Thermoplasmatota archaeon]